MKMRRRTGLGILALIVGLLGPVEVLAQAKPDLISDTQLCPFAGTQLTLKLETSDSENQQQLLRQVQQVISKRVVALGVTSAAVIPVFPDQLQVQLPPEQDAEVAAKTLTNTAQIEFLLQKPDVGAELIDWQQRREQVKDEYERAQAQNSARLPQLKRELKQLDAAGYAFFQATGLRGNHVKTANARPNDYANSESWTVLLEFDSEGSQQFADLTQAAAKTGRPIGIFYDRQLIATPSVGALYADQGITGGKAEIAGNFDAQQAAAIATQLNSGSLPAPVTLTQVETVQRDTCD